MAHAAEPAGPCTSVVVRYSLRGRERVWCGSIGGGVLYQGEVAAEGLLQRFVAGCGATQKVTLCVVPARPGGPAPEVQLGRGQSLASFLERSCREDGIAFQLRANFAQASSEEYVQVRVAFPGTTASAAAADGPEPQPTVEQFECRATSTVAELKAMIQQRTGFPASRSILLLGRRLHDDWPISNVGAASRELQEPLQLHIATGGAFVFLRREGLGHCEPSGSCRFTLRLPRCVQVGRERSVPFDLSQTFGDVRSSVQAVSGLPLSGLQLTLIKPVSRSFIGAQDSEVVDRLGFIDGCILEAWYQPTEESVLADESNIPLDAPTEGTASVLYARAAAQLGLSDSISCVIFAGTVRIERDSDLRSIPLADGVVLSVYVASELQLSFSILTPGGDICIQGEVELDTRDSSSRMPAMMTCSSSSAIADVRRQVGSAAGIERAMTLRGSKVFAMDRSTWNRLECCSFSALADVLGHFVACSDAMRLSRLGITHSDSHLVFVPERVLLVETEISIGADFRAKRTLRTPVTTRLGDFASLLEQSLEDYPLEVCPAFVRDGCRWFLGDPSREALTPGQGKAKGMVAKISDVLTSGKRKSIGGAEDKADKGKRRRLSLGSHTPEAKHMGCSELCGDEFIGDLHAERPEAPRELPAHFLCPVTLDVMQDPVVVAGSGNTYDRKSIQRHLANRFSDPLTNVELRRLADRRLVPNNALRSQIGETIAGQVDLRVAACFRARDPLPETNAWRFLGRCTSLLSGAVKPPLSQAGLEDSC